MVQLGAESAVAQVGGRLFTLPGTMSAVVGQQIPLLVKEGGQKPVLVPVPSGEGEGGGPEGVEDSSLDKLLRSLGAPLDRAHREILWGLLANGRPITGEILRQLALQVSPKSGDGSHQEATKAALGRLLESFDLPSDEQHLLAARQLLAWGIPITRENLRQLIRTLAHIGAKTASDFEAAAYLRANNLPITTSTLELASALLEDPHSLGRQLHTLRTVLAMLADALEPSASQLENERVGKMRQLVEQAAQQLSQRILMSEAGDRSRLVESLQRLVKDQGTSLEARLAGVLAGEAEISELEGDLRALLGQLVDTALTVNREGRGDVDLRRAATLLRATATELADGLQAQQLRNVAEPAPGQERWLSFQLPVSVQKEEYPRMAELRIGHEAGDKIDPNRLSLVLRLELEQLKTVEMRMQICGQQISCNLASDREATVPLLQGEFEILRQTLETLGYSVATARFGLLDPKNVLDEVKNSPEQLSRVDYRV